MELQDTTIVFYTTQEHLNPTIALTKLINKHHPSISITIISTATESSVPKTPPSITYRRLNAVNLPDNFTTDPVELFFEIPRLNNPNLLEALQNISKTTKIKALVIDFFCNSAFEVSTSLNIPTFYDVSVSASDLCTFLYYPKLHDTVPQNLADFNDYVEIPGCPLIHSSDLPAGMFYRQSNIYKHFMSTSINMRKSSGILVNAFDALEYRAKTALVNGLCNPDGPSPPVYMVSPAIAETEHAQNGDVSKQKHECLSWLDSQPNKSVIFLCFGRWGSFKSRQLREIAIGLEQSGCRFLWAVRNLAESDDLDLNELLPEGFLSRTKEVGFVINAWAPQKEVLGHDAVGGFVTHCGWNSVLEAVSFGVPMIGWPLYAEQRMNRVFMVEEMKVALPLDEEEDGLVNAVEIEKRVRELMESVNGRRVRQRVEELRIAAKAAVRKGGSSLVALEKFVESVSG